MARTNSPTQNRIDPTRPFYAAVGTVDAAVERARTGLNEAQTRLSKVDLEPRALAGQGRTIVFSRVDTLQKEAAALPARAQTLVNLYVTELGEAVDDLNKQYVDLAARGRTLVNRIRRQQATQDLKSSARTTKSSAKRTTTQTKRAAETAAASTRQTAGTAKSSSKATSTSARKTASAAKRTASGAAKKTGQRTNRS